MSLTNRIKSAQRNPSNIGGCQTCQWLSAQPKELQRLVNEWLEDKTNSRQQLYEILSHPEEEQRLHVSLSGFRFHLRHHEERFRGDH